MKSSHDTRSWFRMFFDSVWPVFVAIAMVALWLGQRVETPDQKTRRILTHVEPVRERTAVLERGMEKLADKVDRIDRNVSALLERVPPAPGK